ncbi:b24b1fd7-fde2-4f5a-9ec6-22fcc66919cf [Thermothielavioides terrestris]|uniref:B24b1fd7-fde2-4f5a-9ec6-22fcc66919cf n=1 Tax=Thermothielavioides terrestris TaxID=2587410 RepID=A0A3S4F0E7_9PEZI|nr:b24b1fd7-fde2-4f5a-9ec6-22fcc66919cf [Thermothielavioides terrestris]
MGGVWVFVRVLFIVFTGSEDEDEDEDDNEHSHDDDDELVGVEKGEGDEEWELQGGAEEKHGEARRQSDERQPLQRRRRRRRQLYTAEEEKAVVAKFDRRLVVFMAVLYLLSFVDRSNIGNARVAGMDDDLQSVPPRDDWYEWSLGAFYLAYIVFEWMSMLWRLIPAHIYVAALVLSWGVTASLQAVAVNYPMLIAGFTGVPFYLSFFFKRDELAFRTAIFVSAAPLATTFAAWVAWLILKLGEAGPIAPWRLLFLLEGFPSVLVAALAWRIIPDSPQTAAYLTPREKKVARLRLQAEQPPTTTTHHHHHHHHKTPSPSMLNTLSVLTDPAAWLTAAIFFLANLAYSSLPVFLPTILRAMGHSRVAAQALSAPPYLAAFVLVLATARASDASRARAPWLIGHALASAAGYAVLAAADAPWLRLAPGSMVRYAAVFPAAVGFFSVVVLTIAWNVNNARHRHGAAGFALMQAVGQCGPLVGTRLYPDADAPYYSRGMAVCAGAMVGVAVLAAGLRWWLARVNRRWDREEEEEAEEGRGEGAGEDEALVDGGDGGRRKRAFRYML